MSPHVPHLTLADVARRFPGSRGAPSMSVATVGRWITLGVLDATGRRVRLAATRLGGRWLVTEPALEAFAAAPGAAAVTPNTTTN